MRIGKLSHRGVITNPEEFFGREQEIGEIVSRLRAMASLSVVGERRIGKSSLLYHLYYVWTDECSDAERGILVELALGKDIGQDRRRAALQSLLRKEIVEKDQNGYRLGVKMFGFWILRNGAASGSERVS